MTDLSKDTCEACNKLTPKLSWTQAKEFLGQLQGWKLDEKNHLQKRWKFKDFATAKKLVDAISEIAEDPQVKHHPNINFGWGFVEVTVWTHAIDGLSKNDFILAAKIDTLVI
ncbi:MAG: pterin-4-alpha-carbinolamine dehydratase [Parcubacteria group bacterium Gr01-1014_13]|nr:MAG: pterin-4-alpha-carbinolamine dehydratase [Parcubacteria group bacterium Gr01-1014_13]